MHQLLNLNSPTFNQFVNLFISDIMRISNFFSKLLGLLFFISIFALFKHTAFASVKWMRGSKGITGLEGMGYMEEKSGYG